MILLVTKGQLAKGAAMVGVIVGISVGVRVGMNVAVGAGVGVSGMISLVAARQAREAKSSVVIAKAILWERDNVILGI